MSDERISRGVLDTSVVIDLERIDPLTLPLEVAVTAITMAELAAGPHATADPAERARRQTGSSAQKRPSTPFHSTRVHRAPMA